ncbi:MAG: M14 family metallopeptidase [Ignavibacteria bacterium]|nr:M14 family metallopeptidase [Ignavibacteria bacterium]
MTRRIFFLLITLSTTVCVSQTIPEKWLTYYEQSGFKKTPRYAETIEFCKRLEKASPWIKVMSFGKSPEGRDLSLVIASKERAFDPVKASKSNKAILLIQNGIHAGEIDGKDACLMLLRDIAITKTKSSLLDHVILLVIPVYNVDGHERFGPYNRINQQGPEEMGWRVTGQNLNLNRDYLKADAPETQAWLKLFTSWLPDFFIDCHVTDGANFQHAITYGIEYHENVASTVRTWILDKYLPALSHLETGGAPVAPYIFLRDDKDPTKGLQGGTAPPRFSTIYVTLQNRPGLLIETHMLKDYKTRVSGTYRMIEVTLERMNQEYTSLRSAVRSADAQTSKGVERPFPLQFESVDVPNQVFHYMGLQQKNEPSEISGGTRTIYTQDPFEVNVPRYDSIKVTKFVDPPTAYLIPQQWKEVIERLRMHGVKIERLKVETELDVELYRFSNAKWQQTPFEGRHGATYSVETMNGKRTFPAGTAVVRLNQRAGRVVLHALEPEAPDAFAAWGFFDAVFEQKEYAEDYVMESMAREMLAKDPALKKEFDSKLQSDTAFAKSPGSRLNFFYQHSPYWDNQVNLYPVARLMKDVPLQTDPWR